MTDTDNRRVRVIFKKKVYFDKPYIIPITRDSFGWHTGQELTEEKMLKPELMTKEEKERYPYVINPTDHLKVKHLQWLQLNVDYNKAIYDLLLLSGQWALGKTAYEKDSGKYVGYLEDKLVEAQAKNKFRDDRFVAESLVREAPLSDFRRIALMLNVQVKDFNANIEFMKEDELKDKILEACENYPEKVKMCFSKYNNSVEFDYFILECIHYGILNQKPNGDIFDQAEFIGSNITDVRKALNKKENEYKKTKWGRALDEKKGLRSTANIDKGNQEAQMVNAVKLALFDNNIDDANQALTVLKKYYPKNDAIEGFENHLNGLQNVSSKSVEPKENKKEELVKQEPKKEDVKVNNPSLGENSDITKFRNELQSCDIKALQDKISHHKSKYDPEKAKPIWEDKGALIDYMVKVKFNL